MKKIKNWFKNYWYYYKIPVLCGLFIFVAVLSFAIEYITRPRYDVNVLYIGEKSFDSQFLEKTADVLSKYVPDVDGNGKTVASFSASTVTENPKTEEELASMQKAFLELSVGDGLLFLMDKKLYEGFVEEGLFCDISEYTGAESPQYGISLENNKLADELGLLDPADMYVSVRVLTTDYKDDEKKIAEQQGAFEFIKIISENLK